MVALIEVSNPTSHTSVSIYNESVDLTSEPLSYWTMVEKAYTVTLGHIDDQLYLVGSTLTVRVQMCNSEGYCSATKIASQMISKLTKHLVC